MRRWAGKHPAAAGPRHQLIQNVLMHITTNQYAKTLPLNLNRNFVF